jgi:hypothetical protein
MATIKHACEMNDIILNWKNLKKFVKSEKTDNEINGKDRGLYSYRNTKNTRVFRSEVKDCFSCLSIYGNKNRGFTIN